jgi:hypothetical protein
MKKLLTAALMLLLISTLGWAEDAQKKDEGKYMLMVTEDLKPGMDGEHAKVMREIRASANRNNTNFRWITTSGMTGNMGQLAHFAFASSYAELGKVMQEFDKTITPLQNASWDANNAKIHNREKMIFAEVAPELSYNLEKLQPAFATMWEMNTIQIKPGYGNDYVELMKEVIAAHKAAGINETWITYRVDYGADGPTFLQFTPYKSMADMDVDLGKEHDAAISRTWRNRMQELTKNAVVKAESRLLQVAPEQSRPDESYVAANPAMWKIADEQPVMAKKKKGAKVENVAQR